MADLTEAEVVSELAFDALRPVALDAGKHYVFRGVDGDLVDRDLTGQMPARKTGTVTVTDVASFAVYWDKHHDHNSEIYASADDSTITAVLDAHNAAGARYQQHRLVLELVTTPSWDAWTQYDGKIRGQQDFAEFLEDHYADLAGSSEVINMPYGTVKNVSAATFLEIAQHLTASTKAVFERGEKISNGALKFAYKEDVEVRGGSKGELEVPTVFLLAIKPYEDCDDTTRIVARLRTRTSREVGMNIGYFLLDPGQVKRDAFSHVVGKVEDVTGSVIMRGTSSD
ncbi:MAG TPA: DUF2303 family protein [Streptosporangiaceae bacterium]|nr:DUF2303 family protein [Streptosporangiaceae bacterium]